MIYQFDQFTLDTDLYRLKQGDETVTLEPAQLLVVNFNSDTGKFFTQ